MLALAVAPLNNERSIELQHRVQYCTEPVGEGISLRGEVTVQEGVVGAKNQMSPVPTKKMVYLTTWEWVNGKGWAVEGGQRRRNRPNTVNRSQKVLSVGSLSTPTLM